MKKMPRKREIGKRSRMKRRKRRKVTDGEKLNQREDEDDL